MTSSNSASSIRFGRITVLPARRCVLLDAEPVRIGGRAFDVLQALLERQGEVVSSRDLFLRAWPGVFVANNNLQVQVCALRKIVGAATIITVAGRGYVFDGSIAVQRGEAPGADVSTNARCSTGCCRTARWSPSQAREASARPDSCKS